MAQGFTVWLTGLSGAGKSTLAKRIVEALEEKNIPCEWLDGDVVRTHFSKGLGFSREDREENVRRVGFVCSLLNRHGVAVVASLISPYRNSREENRKLLRNYLEVFVDCPLEICAARDVKGLYKATKEGKVQKMTGVEDPYEPPLHPDVVCHTDKESPGESVEKILKELHRRGWLSRHSDHASSTS